MNTLGRRLSRPVLALSGIGYLAVLSAALIGWHVPPEIVLALTVGAAGTVIVMLRPFVGVHVFLMVMYVAELLGTESGITGMKVVGGVILAGWLFGAAARRRLNVPFNGMVVAMLLFVAWCAVSGAYAVDPPAALVRTFTYVQLALSALMFSSVVDDIKKIRSVLGAIVLWTVVSTLIAVVLYYRGETDVAAGFVGNRNLLASYIIGAVACAYLLHRLADRTLMRFLIMASLPVLFLGLALTFSRTGVIIMGATLFVIWYRVALERGFLVLVGSVALLLVLGYVLPDAFYKRVASIGPALESEADTFGVRVRLWQVGLRMIEDRPVTGVGPGNFVPAHHRYAHGIELRRTLVAHNMYIGVAAEQGLVGLLFFMLVVVFGLRDLRRARRISRIVHSREIALLAVAVEANIFMVLTVGLMGDLETLKYFWVFLGLTLSLGRLARETEADLSGAATGLQGLEGAA